MSYFVAVVTIASFSTSRTDDMKRVLDGVRDERKLGLMD